MPAILLLSLHTSFQVIVLQEQFFSIPILQIKKMTFTNVDRMVKVGLLKHTLKQSVLLQAGSVIFLSGFMSRKSKVKTGRI